MAPFDPSIHMSYYVNVLYKGSVICAGALITRRMIITSSRCFLANELEPSQEFKAREMSILTGNDFGTPKRHVFPVKAFFLPAGEVQHEDIHRMAFLALHEKLDKRTYRYINLNRNVPNVDTPVLISFVDSYTRDITMLKTRVVEDKRCIESFAKVGRKFPHFAPEYICVKNKKGSCSTRPGDPLIVDDMLAGFNVYGEQCDEFEGNHIVDVYYASRYVITFLQKATDMLRALTGTANFNSSMTTRRHQLYTTTVATITVSEESEQTETFEENEGPEEHEDREERTEGQKDKTAESEHSEVSEEQQESEGHKESDDSHKHEEEQVTNEEQSTEGQPDAPEGQQEGEETHNPEEQTEDEEAHKHEEQQGADG